MTKSDSLLFDHSCNAHDQLHALLREIFLEFTNHFPDAGTPVLAKNLLGPGARFGWLFTAIGGVEDINEIFACQFVVLHTRNL